MRSFITAFAMVAVATASFAIGRSTADQGMAQVATTEPVSLDMASLHAMSRNLPELRVDTPY